MKRGKRILSLLLALVMSVGMFTGLATTAFAATEEMTLYKRSCLYDYILYYSTVFSKNQRKYEISDFRKKFNISIGSN